MLEALVAALVIIRELFEMEHMKMRCLCYMHASAYIHVHISTHISGNISVYEPMCLCKYIRSGCPDYPHWRIYKALLSLIMGVSPI